MIAEHRKCIAEMKKLKIMIADMSKYIGALREKGRELFNSYLALKKHLEVLLLDKLFCILIQLKKFFTFYLLFVQELRYTIDRLERENNQKKEIINQVYVYKFFREINSKKCLKNNFFREISFTKYWFLI